MDPITIRTTIRPSRERLNMLQLAAEIAGLDLTQRGAIQKVIDKALAYFVKAHLTRDMDTHQNGAPGPS